MSMKLKFETNWTMGLVYDNFYRLIGQHTWGDLYDYLTSNNLPTRMVSTAKCVANLVYTSRKHGKKEPQSFSHCGSFNHHALQSLNNYRFVFLDFPTDTLGILGLVIYRWKSLENTLLMVMVCHTPQGIQVYSRKMKNKNF